MLSNENSSSPEGMDSDMEVANVLAQGDASLHKPRSSPRSSSLGYSPFRSAMAISNGPRNNTATATPTIHTTSLHQAAARGELTLCRQLLQQQELVDEHDEFELTPLMWAAARDQSEAIELLLQHGARCEMSGEIGETALHLAASGGHCDVLQRLLRHGLTVIDQPTAEGNTALMYAVYGGHRACVKALVECGANLSAKNNRGHSVLQLACTLGYREIQTVIEEYLLKMLEAAVESMDRM